MTQASPEPLTVHDREPAKTPSQRVGSRVKVTLRTADRTGKTSLVLQVDPWNCLVLEPGATATIHSGSSGSPVTLAFDGWED